MNLWIAETNYVYTLVTIAESEEEARRKIENFLGPADRIITITKQDKDVIYV